MPKGVFSKIVVLLVIVLNVLYAREVLSIARAGGVVPDSLTYSWYAFTGAELLALAKIQTSKTQTKTPETIKREE